MLPGNARDIFLSYEHRCQSEVIRQMKGSKVLAIALDPITEKNIGKFTRSVHSLCKLGAFDVFHENAS